MFAARGAMLFGCPAGRSGLIKLPVDQHLAGIQKIVGMVVPLIHIGTHHGAILQQLKLVSELDRVAGAGTVAEETNIALDRLEATLREAGLGLGDVAKVNCYLSDDAFRDEFWAAFDARFPGVKPVRLTQVCDLAGEARVLIDAVAAR